jgi:hypothetical protein
MHEQMLRMGIDLRFQSDPVKKVALALRAAAVYDRTRAEAMERWASLVESTSEERNHE